MYLYLQSLSTINMSTFHYSGLSHFEELSKHADYFLFCIHNHAATLTRHGTYTSNTETASVFKKFCFLQLHEMCLSHTIPATWAHLLA